MNACLPNAKGGFHPNELVLYLTRKRLTMLWTIAENLHRLCDAMVCANDSTVRDQVSNCIGVLMKHMGFNGCSGYSLQQLEASFYDRTLVELHNIVGTAGKERAMKTGQGNIALTRCTSAHGLGHCQELVDQLLCLQLLLKGTAMENIIAK